MEFLYILIVLIVAVAAFSLGTRARPPGLASEDECEKRHIWFGSWYVQCTGGCTDKNKTCTLLRRHKDEDRWENRHKWGERWHKDFDYKCECRLRR